MTKDHEKQRVPSAARRTVRKMLLDRKEGPSKNLKREIGTVRRQDDITKRYTSLPK